MESTTSVGTEIVERVAAREGVDPLDLDPKLYDVIDADALEVLAARAADDGEGSLLVEFAYLGYSVTVDGSEVTIGEAPPTSEA